jgi:hypothetical protein
LVYTYKLVLISTYAIISNLSMKEGSLFVLFCIDETHRTGMLQITFLVSLESSQGEGCMGLVAWRLDLLSRSSWLLNDFFTEN